MRLIFVFFIRREATLALPEWCEPAPENWTPPQWTWFIENPRPRVGLTKSESAARPRK